MLTWGAIACVAMRAIDSLAVKLKSSFRSFNTWWWWWWFWCWSSWQLCSMWTCLVSCAPGIAVALLPCSFVVKVRHLKVKYHHENQGDGDFHDNDDHDHNYEDYDLQFGVWNTVHSSSLENSRFLKFKEALVFCFQQLSLLSLSPYLSSLSSS